MRTAPLTYFEEWTPSLFSAEWVLLESLEFVLELFIELLFGVL